MTILHITTFLQGGAGRVIADLALAQRASGHDVMVVGDDGGAEGYGNYPEYLTALRRGGVRFETVRSTFTRELGLNVAAAARLRQLRGVDRVDIVHAHAAIPALIGRLFTAACGRRVPVLQTMHGWGTRKTPGQAATDVAIMNHADRVIVPSRSARTLLVSLGVRPERIDVIPYGLQGPDDTAPPRKDVARIERLRAATGTVGLCVGTIGARKNQQAIVDALALPDAVDVGMVFVGDGEIDALKARARAVGVAGRVVVLGSRPSASRYLPLVDLSVLMSRNEGLPLSVLEAMRDRVPIVASDIPEIAEVFVDGAAATLCDPDDTTAIARALRMAAGETPLQRLRATTRNHRAFLDRYALDRMLTKYRAAYDGLIEAAAAAESRRSGAYPA